MKNFDEAAQILDRFSKRMDAEQQAILHLGLDVSGNEGGGE